MNRRLSVRSLGRWSALVLILPLTVGAAPSGAEGRRKQMKFDKSFGREEAAIKEALRPVIGPAARSTVHLIVDKKAVALATAVHGDGYFITKASELAPQKPVQVEFAGGLRLPATVLERLDAYDLALLKVEATGLHPVEWSDQPAPPPGSFLAAVSPSGEAAALGIASVGPRSLYETPKGFLGVRLRKKDVSAAIIDEVYRGGAADAGGLKGEDVVLTVEGVHVKDSDQLVGEVSRRRPGEEIALKVRRGTDEIDIKITLMDRQDFMSRFMQGDDPMVLMSGRLSRHRHGFFNVFQHDLVLAPEECGGPLVDLDGRVVGLDIARSGRVESLAIPAADLKGLLANVTSGHFTLPDVQALRDNLKRADLAILAAEEARRQAAQTLDNARRLIEAVPAKKDTATAMPAAMPAMP